MTVITEITSKENPLIKLISALQTSSKIREDKGLFVLEGIRICRDALENGIKFDKLVVSESALNKYRADVEIFAGNTNQTIKIPDSLFKKISDTKSPQGIIALGIKPPKNADITVSGRYIALENISDPSNLGAVSRTAEALGVSGIILSSSGCDPYSPKVLRASMGTIMRMPIFITDKIIDFVRENNLRSFGCVVDKDAQSIGEIKFKNGDVLIIGNEANGLLEETKKNTHQNITIKMKGSAESLNAAAAAAIAMWEMMRG